MKQSLSTNRYLAHSLLRYIGQSGAACDFEHHTHFTPIEWEFCTLQDIERALPLIEQGLDPEQVEQRLWEEACTQQDSFGTPRFYQITYCCNACTLKVLISHLNDKHLAQSLIHVARPRRDTLLLASDRSNMLPFVAANFPYNVRAADIGSFLKEELTAQ